MPIFLTCKDSRQYKQQQFDKENIKPLENFDDMLTSHTIYYRLSQMVREVLPGTTQAIFQTDLQTRY